MNQNTRIEMTDTMFDVIRKMTEGNPGAMHVCVSLLKEGVRIDPDDFMGPMGAILQLDTFGIYGPRIWQLYSDVCGSNLTKAAAMLRAVQLGLLREKELHHAIDNRGDGLDVDAAHASVRERLPAFAES